IKFEKPEMRWYCGMILYWQTTGKYQSGFLDVKLIMNESENFIGEVITELPPMFVLKKGSKIKLKKRDLLYKPNYK
ncbi:MAG: hypothetical protein QNK28_11995, partial [Desulfobacterales bacterium]|nr:hypothetical protein [Desulfobacterales bacterium]